MAKANRKCLCCNKEYDYCPTCASDKVKESWHINWCSEKCRAVFKAVSGFNYNKDKEPVLQAIKEYNISNFSEFKPSIKNVLESIWKADLKAKKLAEKKAKEFEEQERTAVVEEIVEVVVPVDNSVDVD